MFLCLLDRMRARIRNRVLPPERAHSRAGESGPEPRRAGPRQRRCPAGGAAARLQSAVWPRRDAQSLPVRAARSASLSIRQLDAADDADCVLLVRTQTVRRFDVDVRLEGELRQANFLLCFLDF